MPIEAKVIGKTKGYPIVVIGIVFGIIQAIFTLPRGGGLLLCVMPGAIIAIIGFSIFMMGNKLPDKVKFGAKIAVILLVISVILSVIQISLLNQAESELQELDENSEDINAFNWEEKKQELVDGIRKLLGYFLILIFLLASATGLIAIAAIFPPIMGNDKRRFLLIIPLIFVIVAIISSAVIVNYSLEGFREILDDLEVADSEAELEAVVGDLEELEPEHMVIGSQIAGGLNLVALVMVLALSYIITIEVETALLPPPQYPQYYGYPQPPQQMPPPIPPQYYLCPVCHNPLTYYQTGWYCHFCQRYW